MVETVAQTDEHQALIDDTGYESAAVVGLIARGRQIGALSFLHAQADVRYEQHDLEFLGELGDRAALALDNARLYQERDAIARNLQRGLRPPRPARVEGLESSVIFEAAGRGIEIGGDLYDVLPTEDGCWVLIGDVAGKGSAAAGGLGGGAPRGARADPRGRRARGGAGPGQRAAARGDRPERLRHRGAGAAAPGRGRGWTLAAASAGHPPAVHVRKGGARLLGGGTVLGALHDAKVQRHDANFAEGDTLRPLHRRLARGGAAVGASRPGRAGAAGRIPGAAGARGDDRAPARRRVLARRAGSCATTSCCWRCARV